jgi:hypothetical protein
VHSLQNKIKKHLICGIWSVISFSTADLYLQQMDTENDEIRKSPPPRQKCLRNTYAPAEVLDKAYKFPLIERNTSLCAQWFKVYVPKNLYSNLQHLHH